MKLIPSNAIDIGRRTEQQDDFGFSDPNDAAFVAHGGVCAVVIDGMGGVDYGGESARAGKTAFLNAYESKTAAESIPAALARALTEANRAVMTLGRQRGNSRGVGATLTAGVVAPGTVAQGNADSATLHYISVGDSALFVYRAGRLERLTVAHEVIDSTEGALVSSFLGVDDTLTQIDRSAQPVHLRAGDRVLLCSDGLFKSVSEPDIEVALATAPPAEAATQLVEVTLAKDRPAQDNVTAVVIAAEPDATPTDAQLAVPSPAARRSAKGASIAGAALLVLLIAGVGFGWTYWRKQATQRHAEGRAAQIDQAFSRGDCRTVLALLSASDPADRSPAAEHAREQAGKCERYQQHVAEAERALKDAEASDLTPQQRRERLRRADQSYSAALAIVAGDERVRAARDTIRAEVERSEPEKPNPQKKPAKPPKPPRRNPGGGAIAPTGRATMFAFVA
jgi:serine/threonine protein phosphatase PrpC